MPLRNYSLTHSLSNDVNKDSDPKAKDLSHKDRAKDLDFGLKNQGQGITSLSLSNNDDDDDVVV